jgi:hypothetical protein
MTSQMIRNKSPDSLISPLFTLTRSQHVITHNERRTR